MKKRTLLTVLAILVIGSVEIILSSFYLSVLYVGIVLYETSYGFPFGWYGHVTSGGPVMIPFIDADWFSAESLLLDIAFWFTISTIMVITTIKSVSIVHKKKIQKN